MDGGTIQEALAGRTAELMALADVVGVSVGEAGGRPCVRVMLARRNEATMRELPSEIGGYPVVTEVSGELKAQ